jgi:hypothetical protein
MANSFFFRFFVFCSFVFFMRRKSLPPKKGRLCA